MPSMPWVKLWTEMLDDVKLAELTDVQKWRFVQLVLLAGECDAAGALVTGDSRMTHAQIAWKLRCDKNLLDSDIEKLVEVGLITDDGVVQVAKFAERQGPTQEEKRKKWAERQQKRRERANVTRESPVTHADVTPLEEEEEEEEDKEEEGEEEQETDGASAGVVVVSPFELYESEKFGPVTEKIKDHLNMLIDEFSEPWVSDALVKASLANKRNLAYVKGILKNWDAGGKDAPKDQPRADDYKKYKADAEKWGYAT